MTSPTVFGMNGTRLMVGGEAGAEAILPLAEFYTELNSMLDRKLKAINQNVNALSRFTTILTETKWQAERPKRSVIILQ